ncbi:MAG: S49 family peptidase [Pseudomonadota bacterium]
MWPFSKKTVVPVLRLNGVISASSGFRQGLSLARLAGPIERAFTMSDCESVAVTINSPGGSPVQSNLIFKRIRQLAEQHEKKVFVFCEDVAASGGYFIAMAGDEVYVDPSSIVGSIGVVAAGFGFVEAIDKLGVERRVYTAGENKSVLDPFKPEKQEDIDHLLSLQREVHDVFIGVVKSRRGEKLSKTEPDLFTGRFWAGQTAVELGLVDGITDLRTKMQELHGEKVQLRAVPMGKRGLLSRLRSLPSTRNLAARQPFAEDLVAGAGSGLLAALEERAYWSRFGL